MTVIGQVSIPNWE